MALNIDYAAIISKAEARKETLKRLEELLAQAPAHVAHLQAAEAYAHTLKAVYTSLDTEGRQMLPVPVQNSMANAGNIAGRIHAAAGGASDLGLSQLIVR